MSQTSSDFKVNGNLDVSNEINQGDFRYNVSKIDDDNNQSVCDDRKNVVVNGQSINLRANKIILEGNNMFGTALPSKGAEGQLFFKIL